MAFAALAAPLMEALPAILGAGARAGAGAALSSAGEGAGGSMMSGLGRQFLKSGASSLMNRSHGSSRPRPSQSRSTEFSSGAGPW